MINSLLIILFYNHDCVIKYKSIRILNVSYYQISDLKKI
jgi:hypothetical protein